MKKILSLVVVLVVVMTSFGAVQKTFAQSPTGTVNTGALNIRSGPGVSYGVITYVYRNTVLTLLARNADASWVKVMTTTGVQGWVNSRYVLTSYPLSSLPVEGTTGGGITAVVISYGLNVRSGPGVGYARVIAVPNGTVLTLLARDYNATWVKVALPAGTQGWVSTPYISTTYPIINLPVEGGTPTPPTGYRTHVVQPGENLYRIALYYGVNMYDIARLNGITNLALIYAGQVLLIP
jgi:N-acetylmuramoyl-L-alanine amidase